MRVVGAVIALASVGLGALGARSHLDTSLLGLALLAGIAFPLTQAAAGQMTSVTGEPFAAGTISFAMAALGTVVFALAVTSAPPPSRWLAASPPEWVGGVIGATTLMIAAVTIRILGAFRLTLSIVAGQAIGGLAVDLVVPARGERITVLTIVSVFVVLLAVWISGMTRGGGATPDIPLGEASSQSN